MFLILSRKKRELWFILVLPTSKETHHLQAINEGMSKPPLQTPVLLVNILGIGCLDFHGQVYYLCSPISAHFLHEFRVSALEGWMLNSETRSLADHWEWTISSRSVLEQTWLFPGKIKMQTLQLPFPRPLGQKNGMLLTLAGDMTFWSLPKIRTLLVNSSLKVNPSGHGKHLATLSTPLRKIVSPGDILRRQEE